MEGPWPECVGQTGEWCSDYISSWIGYGAALNKITKSFQVVSIVPHYEYTPYRVWIHVGNDNIVMAAPERG